MANTKKSVFDGLTAATIQEISAPLGDSILQSLEGAFIEEAVLRNAGTIDSKVISYKDTEPVRLADSAEVVAEFAEIPTAEVIGAGNKFAQSEKIALGVRISQEMLRQRGDYQLSEQVAALQNEIIVRSARQFKTALDNADVNTLAAATAWTDSNANPVFDILDAVEQIEDANIAGANFGFAADSIVMHKSAYSKLLRSDAVQKFYIGNLASENPLYKGTQPNTVAGLTVHTSSFIPKDEVYVLSSNNAGFYADYQPLITTDLYSENGDNGFGGSNQAWRLDTFRDRVVVINGAKAVTKITGIAG